MIPGFIALGSHTMGAACSSEFCTNEDAAQVLFLAPHGPSSAPRPFSSSPMLRQKSGHVSEQHGIGAAGARGHAYCRCVSPELESTSRTNTAHARSRSMRDRWWARFWGTIGFALT